MVLYVPVLSGVLYTSSYDRSLICVVSLLKFHKRWIRRSRIPWFVLSGSCGYVILLVDLAERFSIHTTLSHKWRRFLRYSQYLLVFFYALSLTEINVMGGVIMTSLLPSMQSLSVAGVLGNRGICCQNSLSNSIHPCLVIRNIRRNAINKVEITVCSRVTERNKLPRSPKTALSLQRFSIFNITLEAVSVGFNRFKNLSQSWYTGVYFRIKWADTRSHRQ